MWSLAHKVYRSPSSIDRTGHFDDKKVAKLYRKIQRRDEKIQRYQERNSKLKSQLKRAIKSKPPAPKQLRLKQHNGRTEFDQTLTTIFGPNMSQDKKSKLFKLADMDGSGELSAQELQDFANLVTHLRLYTTLINAANKSDAKINYDSVFKAIDGDNSGHIDAEELGRILNNVFIQKTLLNPAQVVALINHLDGNADGKLDLQEFKQLLSFFD